MRAFAVAVPLTFALLTDCTHIILQHSQIGIASHFDNRHAISRFVGIHIPFGKRAVVQ